MIVIATRLLIVKANLTTIFHKRVQICTYLNHLVSPITCALTISNSNWTEWSKIQGVIARVISKSDERKAGSRTAHHRHLSFVTRFRSVVVITSALHVEGRRFEPGRKHFFFLLNDNLLPKCSKFFEKSGGMSGAKTKQKEKQMKELP